MAELLSAVIKTEEPKEKLTVPANVKDGPNGSVVVDPSVQVPAVKKEEAGAKTAERPAWLPEKFKTPEDFAASYKELETKLGSQPAKEAAKEPATVAAPVLDLSGAVAEYAKDGALSEATFKALEAKGISRSMVSSYVAGQVAVGKQTVAELSAVVGGQEELKKVLEWSKVNLSKEEAAAYNAALDGNKIEESKLLLSAIHQRYVKANGVDPKLVNGEGSSRSGGAQPYASIAEMQTDMQSKKYENDPAFRQQVIRRLAVSKIL